MKSFKRSLVFLTVLTMLVSAIAPVAFAATPSDVVGTDYEGAVVKLGALGVLSGYPDGSFKPENNITRAEFSKIACYVVGVQNAAELSKGSTKFVDVAASHWASGYINIAVEKGMIKGYPDGTFKPEANVSYAEAVTILVRALGMGPVVEGKGTWPANYLAKASAAGLTDDVSGLVGSAKATRGNIATMAWNTLTAEKWGEKEYTTEGIVYGPIGKTLLADCYKDFSAKVGDEYIAKDFDDVRVIGTQLTGLNADEVTLDYSDNNDMESVYGTANSSTKKFEVAATGIDLNSLFGMKVNVLLGKDNKIVSIMPTNEDVVKGFITDVTTTSVELDDDKEYDFASSPSSMSVNTVGYNKTELKTLFDTLDSKALAVIVLDDNGDIDYMTVNVADTFTMVGHTTSTTTQAYVDEVTSKGLVKDYDGATIVDLDDLDDVDEYAIVKNGKPATKDDIKVGDVVTKVVRADGFVYLALTDAKVEGKVTKVTSDTEDDSHQARRKLTVDGKAYEMVHGGDALVTKTGDMEDAEEIGTTDADYKDFYNEDVKLHLNAFGQVFAIEGTVSATSSLQVGVITKAAREGIDVDGDNLYIDILSTAGLKKTYLLKGDEYSRLTGDALSSKTYTDYDAASFDLTNGSAVGKVVLFKVAADGKSIAEHDLYTVNGTTFTSGDYNIKTVGNLTVYGATGYDTNNYVNADNKVVKVAGTSYYVNSDTKIINSDDVFESLTWNGIANDTAHLLSNQSGTTDAMIVYDGRVIEAIITVIADDTTANGELTEELLSEDDIRYGIFKELETSGDDDMITLVEDGKDVEYVVSGSVYEDMDYADVVAFKLSDGKFVGQNGTDLDNGLYTFHTTQEGRFVDVSEMQDLSDAALEAYEIDEIYDNVYEFTNTTDAVKAADDIVVYDVRDGEVKVADKADLVKGVKVVFANYDDEDDEYDLAVIFAD